MDAKRAALGEPEVRELLTRARKVLVGRGRKGEEISLKEADPAGVAPRLLGRSGTLRAPAVLHGRTLLVGWCEPVWKEHFGA